MIRVTGTAHRLRSGKLTKGHPVSWTFNTRAEAEAFVKAKALSDGRFGDYFTGLTIVETPALTQG